MLTQEQAQKLAQQAVEQYVSACGPGDQIEASKAITKLLSVAATFLMGCTGVHMTQEVLHAISDYMADPQLKVSISVTDRTESTH